MDDGITPASFSASPHWTLAEGVAEQVRSQHYDQTIAIRALFTYYRSELTYRHEKELKSWVTNCTGGCAGLQA